MVYFFQICNRKIWWLPVRSASLMPVPLRKFLGCCTEHKRFQRSNSDSMLQSAALSWTEHTNFAPGLLSSSQLTVTIRGSNTSGSKKRSDPMTKSMLSRSLRVEDVKRPQVKGWTVTFSERLFNWTPSSQFCIQWDRRRESVRMTLSAPSLAAKSPGKAVPAPSSIIRFPTNWS